MDARGLIGAEEMGAGELRGNGAIFSPCRTYRYALWRFWDPNVPHVLFVCLNPSTADESRDDPTLRRCMGYARRWGYGGVVVVNLFAYRATDPRDLRQAADPVGPENDATIAREMSKAAIVVAAWGNGGDRGRRAEAVLTLLGTPYLLRWTKKGQPQHPLYLPGNLPPFRWAARAEEGYTKMQKNEG